MVSFYVILFYHHGWSRTIHFKVRSTSILYGNGGKGVGGGKGGVAWLLRSFRRPPKISTSDWSVRLNKSKTAAELVIIGSTVLPQFRRSHVFFFRSNYRIQVALHAKQRLPRNATRNSPRVNPPLPYEAHPCLGFSCFKGKQEKKTTTHIQRRP